MGTLANIADPDQMQQTWHLIGSSLFALNPEIKVAPLKMGMNYLMSRLSINGIIADMYYVYIILYVFFACYCFVTL